MNYDEKSIFLLDGGYPSLKLFERFEQNKQNFIVRVSSNSFYRYLKRKAAVEVFTGESVTAVLQDFHSAILVLNIAAIAEREQADILLEHDVRCSQGKHKGCLYRPNKTKLISDIKRRFVMLMLCKSKAAKVFQEFMLVRNIKCYAYLDIPKRRFHRNFSRCLARRSTHPKSPF